MRSDKSYSELLYQDGLRKTQSLEKFFSYIDSLLGTLSFLQELKSFRIRWVDREKDEPLPDGGLPLPKDMYEHTDNLEMYVNLNREDEEYRLKEALFREKYELNMFGDAFEFLIFYNSVEPLRTTDYLSFFNTLDLKAMLATEDGLFDEKDILCSLRSVVKNTPIALLIHPYMSERDIIDAVRKTYREGIAVYQKAYRKEGIGLKDSRRKSKRIKERNLFIYENKKLPIQELTALVNNKFRDGKWYDSTYVRSILKKEEEKRSDTI